MLSIVPDFDLEPGLTFHFDFTFVLLKTVVLEPTEIVFLVDCSGSMGNIVCSSFPICFSKQHRYQIGGSRIEAAKRALQVFLLSLPQSCHFNIVRFGSSYNQLFVSGSESYNEVIRWSLIR